MKRKIYDLNQSFYEETSYQIINDLVDGIVSKPRLAREVFLTLIKGYPNMSSVDLISKAAYLISNYED